MNDAQLLPELHRRLTFLGLFVSNFSIVELFTHQLVWLLMGVEQSVGSETTGQWQVKQAAELGLRLLKKQTAQIPKTHQDDARKLLTEVIRLSDDRGVWGHALHSDDGYSRIRSAIASRSLPIEPVEAAGIVPLTQGV